MLSTKIQKALNDQINAEFGAAYIYLSMSAYFTSVNLDGFASWMRTQAQEEMGHAMRIYDFINDRDGKIQLKQVAAPPASWKTPLDAFQATYAHEQKVTGMIYDIVDLSLKERDHATNSYMQWFVNEQVEEEATANDIVSKLKLVGDDNNGLFLLDRDLATRSPEQAPAGEA
jgi:ferritin